MTATTKYRCRPLITDNTTVLHPQPRLHSVPARAPVAATAVNFFRQPTAFAAPIPNPTTLGSSGPTFYQHKGKTKTPIPGPGHAATMSESESASSKETVPFRRHRLHLRTPSASIMQRAITFLQVLASRLGLPAQVTLPVREDRVSAHVRRS